MTLLRPIPFEFEGRAYEIRVYSVASLINVAVFHRNRPATGYRHHIQLAKYMNPERIMASAAFSETVKQAKRDITEKRWERLSSGAETAQG